MTLNMSILSCGNADEFGLSAELLKTAVKVIVSILMGILVVTHTGTNEWH